MCIARDPRMRLHDIVAAADLTERTATTIVTDLTRDGYVVRLKDGRRNCYQVQADHSLHEDSIRVDTLGELLDILVGPP